MNRPLLLVAARTSETAVVLKQFINLFVPSDEILHIVETLHFTYPAELFETLDNLSPERLFNTMVVLDTGSDESEGWNVMRMKGEKGLFAQLVLSYPEVYFVFVGTSNFGSPVMPNIGTIITNENFNNHPFNQTELESFCEIVRQHHFVEISDLFRVVSLIKLHSDGFRTLFDASGLRSCLKLQLLKELKAKLPNVLAGIYDKFSQSRLKSSAFVAEEESSFLYLNGYAAYKFGCRSWLAYSLSEFLRLLNDAEDEDRFYDIKTQQKFETAVMDWHLVYRDDEAANDEKIQSIRDKALQSNSKISFPIVVTSFPQALESETYSWFEKAVVLQKPYGGLFDLLLKQPNQNSKLKINNNCYIKYENIWKSIEEEINTRLNYAQDNKKQLSHSAPYACSAITERLLSRANQIKLSEPIATELWVYAALLAGEAKEILGGLSLTTSYQALALQHEAEVRAEVSFLGMSTEIEVQERLKCLSREIGQIQKAANGFSDKEEDQKRISEIGKLNCLLSIIHSLRLRFISHEQIDASEICLNEYVKHHQQFKQKTNWASKSNFAIKLFRAGFSWFPWYLDKVTKSGTSVTRLFICSFGWIFCFFISFWILFFLHPSMNNDVKKSALTAVGYAAFTFIELQPGISEPEEMRQDIMPEHPQVDTTANIPPEQSGSGLETESKETAKLKPERKPERKPIQWNSQQRTNWLIFYWILLSTELVIAYIHLGLLISVLYRRITKRAP